MDLREDAEPRRIHAGPQVQAVAAHKPRAAVLGVTGIDNSRLQPPEQDMLGPHTRDEATSPPHMLHPPEDPIEQEQVARRDTLLPQVPQLRREPLDEHAMTLTEMPQERRTDVRAGERPVIRSP